MQQVWIIWLVFRKSFERSMNHGMKLMRDWPLQKGRLTSKGLCITGQVRQRDGAFFARGLAVQWVAQSKRIVQTELWTRSGEAIHREQGTTTGRAGSTSHTRISQQRLGSGKWNLLVWDVMVKCKRKDGRWAESWGLQQAGSPCLSRKPQRRSRGLLFYICLFLVHCTQG